jgi:hypothetical protein
MASAAVRFRYAAVSVFALVVGAGVSWSVSRAAPAPGAGEKSPIKEIMKQSMKGDDSLFKKVQSGNGSKEEKAQLLAAATELAKHDPPRGDKKGWQDKCAALVKACQAVNDGAADGLKQLKTAGDCKGCHTAYKPPMPKR